MAQSVKPISDHAELENLAYADAGHTGFAASVTVPVEVGTALLSMQSKPYRGVGQITLTNGSVNVVGIGTTFIGVDQNATTLTYWYQIFVDGETYYFDDVPTDTTAVLSEAWAGSTQTIDLVYSSNIISNDMGIAFGKQNLVTGNAGIAIGGFNVVAGTRGLAFGESLLAPAINEVAVGLYNADYTPANDATDRIFSVGAGDYGSGRKDGLAVYKNARAKVGGDTFGVDVSRTPASASATGTTGSICWDSSYLYICTDVNTWRRIAHATW